MMNEKKRTYIAIDLKSFYASVECIERKLDPMDTNLVVADITRTEKTICLAVSPTLKSYGISGRARLFEVVQRIKQENAKRRLLAPSRQFTGKSTSYSQLIDNPELEIGYEVAKPRMAHYIKYSSDIFKIYLKYIAPEDIHVYSIDEVFIDATAYLKTYKMTAKQLAMTMIQDVLKETGITATAGIGTNLYLCKIAMDIVAKHVEPNKDGVRIAELDEMTYRRQLWDHTPITDFWRVGRGYAEKLKKLNIYTMGDVAKCSIKDEDLLYDIFGVNAELLIDHAWGYEPVTIEEIKAYRPENTSFSSGQVLQTPYEWEKARLVVHEMADTIALDLVEKGMVTDQLVLTVGYDMESLTRPKIKGRYKGEVTIDKYGRRIPKHSHGTTNLPCHTSSTKVISEALMELYDKITNHELLIRRLTISTNHVIFEKDANKLNEEGEQLSIFMDYDDLEAERKKSDEEMERERKMQEAMISIKEKYGKNAVLKGMNLMEGATGKSRNSQIGGHKA